MPTRKLRGVLPIAYLRQNQKAGYRLGEIQRQCAHNVGAFIVALSVAQVTWDAPTDWQHAVTHVNHQELGLP